MLLKISQMCVSFGIALIILNIVKCIIYKFEETVIIFIQCTFILLLILGLFEALSNSSLGFFVNKVLVIVV